MSDAKTSAKPVVVSKDKDVAPAPKSASGTKQPTASDPGDTKAKVVTPTKKGVKKGSTKTTKVVKNIYKRIVKITTANKVNDKLKSNGYAHRMLFYRTPTGETLFIAKLPVIEDKSAYTGPIEAYVTANPDIKNTYKLTDFFALRGSRHDQPLDNGRQSVWKAGVYVHANLENNTNEWASKWAKNWAKLYTELTSKERGLSKYESKYLSVETQTDADVKTAFLGTFLTTYDVLRISEHSHQGTSIKQLVEDDAFINTYFGPTGVHDARVIYNEMCGEQLGNLTVSPFSMANPTALIDGFEAV